MTEKKPTQKEPQVELDFNNLMADILKSSNGLTSDDLNSFKAQMAVIHKDLIKRRKSGELPFYDLPFQSQELKNIRRMADEIRKRTENFVVLGIGGSALGTKALFKALSPSNHNLVETSKRRFPRLFVADNVDPESMATLLNFVDPRRTVFNVISKSGTTTETMSQFLIVNDRLRRSLGKSSIRDHIILTTDPSEGLLREIADTEGFRSLPVPPGVGGRFSVLSAVGLLPLAVVGVNVAELLKGAAQAAEACTQSVLMKNPAYTFAVLAYAMNKLKKRTSIVMMPYADALSEMADWFNQLWAESLGKLYSTKGKEVKAGQTPIKAIGATDQHSQLQLYMEGPEDKLIVFLGVNSYRVETRIPLIYKNYPDLAYLGGHTLSELIQTEQIATARALAKAKRPNMTMTLSKISPASLGYLIYMLEVAAVVSGYLYKVNPLDQPGVEASKEFTYGLMGRPGFESQATKFNKGPKPKKKYIL